MALGASGGMVLGAAAGLAIAAEAAGRTNLTDNVAPRVIGIAVGSVFGARHGRPSRRWSAGSFLANLGAGAVGMVVGWGLFSSLGGAPVAFPGRRQAGKAQLF